MGFFNRFRPKNLDVSNPGSDTTDVLLRAILGGDGSITREKAMRIPAVASNVDLIANTVAMVPIKLYQTVEEDGRKKVVEVDDERVKLLDKETGDTLDSFQFKKALVTDYLLGKGGYAYIRKERNRVKSIHYVEEKEISIAKNTDPIFKEYKILVTGKQYEPFEFITLLRNTKDGASGVGLIAEVSKAIETAYATMLYQLNLVNTGGNKKGFLKSKKTLGQEAIDTLKAAWNSMYKTNEENVIVLNEGLDFQESSNSSVEMQLNESKLTLNNEIDNIFHVRKDFDEFFKVAIKPILTALEVALNRDFLTEKEKKKLFWACDTKEITKGSLKERYEAYKVAKDTGWITKNEIRLEENREAIDGLDTVDVGLASVLYDINSKSYYTPNTGETKSLEKGGNE